GTEARQEVLTPRGLEIWGLEEGYVVNTDLFYAYGARRCPVLIQSPANGDSCPQTRLGVLIVNAVEVVAAHSQTVLAVEKIRLTPAYGIALEARTGNGFRAKLLTGATKGMTAEQIFKTRRNLGDVKIPFIERDTPDQTSVGVDTDTEDQAARFCLLDADLDV